MKISPPQVRKAMEQVSGKSLESLNDAEKASALQTVAKDMGAKPVDLLNQLEKAFPDAFGGGQNAMEQLGASATYNASAGQLSQQGRTMGTRLQAMAGGGIVANEAQIKDFWQVGDAGDIRAKAKKLPEMSQAYAQLTGAQLKEDVSIPPRVQTVVDKQLANVAKQTAAHFSPEGFQVQDNPELNKLALGQHVGYVAGELSRNHGASEPEARKALSNYFEGGGDVDKLLSDLGMPGRDTEEGKSFLNNNGWMFSGGLDDKNQWGFWGFGATDQALNRPGVYAGEATLNVAEALEKGNGAELMASTLTKDPSEWNANEQIVGNFALRAAQSGWLTSKLGQGVVEAHNPKKEGKAPSRWAPGNDLIVDFNTLRETKGWKEVVKDLDQVKSFATTSGILTPGGNPADASYYKQVGGQKMDREVLKGFERAQAGPRDGRVSGDDVGKFIRPAVMDGTAATDIELATLDYAEGAFNLTPKAAKELANLKVDAKLTRADEFSAQGRMFVEGDGHTPDYVNFSTTFENGGVSVQLRDNDVSWSGNVGTNWSMKVDGEPVQRRHRTAGPIPYGQWEGERESINTFDAHLKSGTHLIELENASTGETRMMKVTVPDTPAVDNAKFKPLFQGKLDSDKLQPLTDVLVGGAAAALEADSFALRNAMMSDVVAGEGGLMAARSAGVSLDDAAKVQDIFKKAARGAGNEFRKAFDKDGNKLEDQGDAYKAAMSEAGDWAKMYMDDLAGAVGMSRSGAKRIANNARLEDIADIVARDLGLPKAATDLSGAELKELIAEVVPQDDYFYKEVANLKTRDEGDPGLSDGEQNVLSMGIRLANATWKAGQVHRAAWEGNNSRIDPEQRTAFNTFDSLKVNMFNQTVEGSSASGVEAQKQGFARAVFEVYKDLLQIAD